MYGRRTSCALSCLAALWRSLSLTLERYFAPSATLNKDLLIDTETPPTTGPGRVNCGRLHHRNRSGAVGPAGEHQSFLFPLPDYRGHRTV